MPTKPQIKTFTNASVDVLNAIRNNASTDYRNKVPVATADANIVREIGTVIMDSAAFQNEFMQSLINRIGRVIVTSKSYTNPLAMFKRGFLDFGEKIEEVFIKLARPFQYDPAVAESELFKREIPDAMSAFHSMNYQKFYKNTTQEQDLRQAFLSIDGVSSFIYGIIDQLYTAMEYDEFLVMKYMIARHISKGQIAVQQIDAANIDDTTIKMRKASNDFLFMNPDHNLAGVHTHTLRENQYVIINTLLDATQSVKSLARAFNMGEAEFLGHVVLVDGFGKLDIARLNDLFAGDANYYEYGEDELKALNAVPALLVDKDWFMIFDKLLTFREVENVQGLYWNHVLHTWKIFSVSPFAQALLFVPGEPTVTKVTVNPSTITIKAGQSAQLSATVETTNFAPQAVTWISNSENVTVTATGTVTVAKSASGKATITARSVFDSSKTGTCVITIN